MSENQAGCSLAGGHQYQTEGGKELVCRVCRYVYEPPVRPVVYDLKPVERSINQHEGKKYLRSMRSAVDPNVVIQVDIYNVLVAFNVTCPALSHCIKKLLAPGQRGKGSVLSDLQGALAALRRAIELQEEREAGQ